MIEVVGIVLYKGVLWTYRNAQPFDNALILFICFEGLFVVLGLQILDNIFECILLSLDSLFVVSFVNIKHVFF